MKLTKLLVIPFLFSCALLSAQQTTYNYNDGQIGAIYTKKTEAETAQGSQYYNEKFMPASVDSSKDISMVRYNAYNDEIEVEINDEVMVLKPANNQIVQLKGNGLSYEYLQYTDKEGTSKQRYLITVNKSDKVSIYKEESIYLQPEEHPTSGYGRYKAPQFRKNDIEYYIQFNNGEIVHMSTKKKDVLSLVPGKEKEIKAFIKENKISTDEDEDLKQLANYLGTLI
ncbi:hypothetical protein [Flavobacterium beibuense]|uniref:Uncharacterized protein n=1 Tax=Flavobacterium beibuense F44-8 TaxID=1406840 RepID=A0A0A2LKQ7_9FLAO|nr:hypothetical protein [Flavobacterium beibuense]KGO80499.1 hypothetical protein Q763_10820 [Flavobacterium beibuense F44-8]